MAKIFQHQNPKHSQDPLPLESCHRKGPWTPEEDQLLITGISSLGVGRWDSIAKASGLNRNGKSCRLRWVNYLRPDLKRGKITYEEEQRILELQKLWINKWSRIGKCLPGRTDNEIKNYFRNHLRKGNKRGFCKDGINGSVIGRDRLNDQQHHHHYNHQTQEEFHQSQYSSEESDDCSANIDSSVTRILCDFQGDGLMDEGTIAFDIIASSTDSFVDNTFFDYSDQLWKIN